ncbi:MAG: OmpA family protein [Chitinophagaceae bacterium]|nr:OmpA family protein [Chitinophagaceae bacterium]
MKKILAVLLALYLFVPASFGQDDEVRPAAIGLSYVLNDFRTANLIRTTSLSSVLANKQWTKPKQMSPGIAVSYFKGLYKKVDFAGTAAFSFLRYPMTGKTFFADRLLVETDASLNLKMVSEKYWVQPYLIAGIGASMYAGKYFGAFIPTGVGLKVNFFDDAHLFVTSQYRIPVTTETTNYHFFHQFGIAGRIGKKKEPAPLKPLPPAPTPPVDTDKDGIVDSLDKCPTVPGLAKYQGCPIPDTDKDGINDEEDKCPTVAGLARYQGCPIPDTDKDGINDEEDKCPTEAGPASNNGCPFVDTDGDGIIDQEDWCPNEKGLPENHGCPKLEEYNFNAKSVQFATGSAKLLPSATKELDKLVTILNEHANFNISIEGHTDNTGKPAFNQTLSAKRAEAVKAYLVKKGISAERLSAAGFGQDQPIEDNKTVKGRAANRRVEFKLVK